MFTVCPKCTLTLAVTTADLRVGQGYVRCGRCSSVFNALAALHDERLPEDAPRSSAAGTTSRPALVEAQPAAPPAPQPAAGSEPPAPGDEIDEIDINLEDDAAAATAVDINLDDDATSASRIDIALDPDAPPREELEFDLTGNDLGKIFIEPTPNDEPTGTFETIVLEGDGMPPVEDFDPDPIAAAPARRMPRDEPEAQALRTPRSTRSDPVSDAADLEEIAARARDAAAPSTSGTAQFPALPLAAIRTHDTGGAVSPQAAEAAAEAIVSIRERTLAAPSLIEPEPRGRVLAWMTGCVLLGLLLFVQLVHHFRDELAASPGLHAPMSAIYSALGAPLTPRWNLLAYDIRQLGAVSAPDASGDLVVRASIANAADRPQPVPLLRLTLQDRYGKRLASRDLEPQEYLGADARELLDPGQRIDAAIAVVDPGSDAVGFELDACLRRGGGIACAADEQPAVSGAP